MNFVVDVYGVVDVVYSMSGGMVVVFVVVAAAAAVAVAASVFSLAGTQPVVVLNADPEYFSLFFSGKSVKFVSGNVTAAIVNRVVVEPFVVEA